MRFFVAFLLATGLTATWAQELVSLQTRPGVNQAMLIERAPEKPRAVALLFPGSGGRVDLRTIDGEVRLRSNNFLVRSRQEFVARGVVAVVLDAPSDRDEAGMDDAFRMGDAHATDIAAAMTEVKKRFAGLPVFLVGTSRGTVSAAALGRRMADEVAGVVLTATLFEAGRRVGRAGLAGFDFSSIRAPLLFAHHRQDGCAYTPYSAASRLAGRFPLISVTGGLPAQSAPCEPRSAHGFLGREAETVEAIANWMLKQPFRSEID